MFEGALAAVDAFATSRGACAQPARDAEQRHQQRRLKRGYRPNKPLLTREALDLVPCQQVDLHALKDAQFHR